MLLTILSCAIAKAALVQVDTLILSRCLPEASGYYVFCVWCMKWLTSSKSQTLCSHSHLTSGFHLGVGIFVCVNFRNCCVNAGYILKKSGVTPGRHFRWGRGGVGGQKKR